MSHTNQRRVLTYIMYRLFTIAVSTVNQFGFYSTPETADTQNVSTVTKCLKTPPTAFNNFWYTTNRRNVTSENCKPAHLNCKQLAHDLWKCRK